jgi:hypothetical protein
MSGACFSMSLSLSRKHVKLMHTDDLGLDHLYTLAKASKSIKLILDDVGLDLGLDHLHVFARAKLD